MGGTTDRVVSSKVIRVALLAGTDAADRTAVERYLRALEADAGAHARITTGAAEPLLARLEKGDFDLALGSVAADSPWIDDVSLIDPPLVRRSVGARDVGLTPIARNGENRWIMRLERLARDKAPR